MTRHPAPPLSIPSLKADVARHWTSASASLAPPPARYSREEQLFKEQVLEHRLREADELAGGLAAPRGTLKSPLAATRRRLQSSIVQFLHTFDCVIDREMEESFSGVTDDFIREAYAFDPDIAQDDVYQASRNVLIMNTFQMHLGQPVRLTPAVFAYSMLYPVTDNYLDSAAVTAAAKHEANDRLRQRLSGVKLRPRNGHEAAVDALIGMIEGEFDRDEHPEVYESLLAIHGAQCRSVSQQNGDLPAAELLDISIEKGGSSVLADGYLVAGNLLRTDELFFFRFGVLLQLIDDLQDIGEDARQGHQTLARAAAENGGLEAFTDRLGWYMAAVLRTGAGETLRRLIERSCRLLILEAIASHTALFSGAYLRAMESQAPVRFDYLRKMKGQIRDRCDRHPDLSAIYGLSRTDGRTAA